MYANIIFNGDYIDSGDAERGRGGGRNESTYGDIIINGDYIDSGDADRGRGSGRKMSTIYGNIIINGDYIDSGDGDRGLGSGRNVSTIYGNIIIKGDYIDSGDGDRGRGRKMTTYGELTIIGNVVASRDGERGRGRGEGRQKRRRVRLGRQEWQCRVCLATNFYSRVVCRFGCRDDAPPTRPGSGELMEAPKEILPQSQTHAAAALDPSAASILVSSYFNLVSHSLGFASSVPSSATSASAGDST